MANRLYKSTLIFFTALLLLGALSLHTLNVPHRHPAFFGEGIAAFAHGEDKKMLAVLVSFFAFWLLAQVVTEIFSYRFNRVPSAIFEIEDDVPKFSNYIFQLLRLGILEPKLH